MRTYGSGFPSAPFKVPVIVPVSLGRRGTCANSNIVMRRAIIGQFLYHRKWETESNFSELRIGSFKLSGMLRQAFPLLSQEGKLRQ
jgi:hypothetical protein